MAIRLLKTVGGRLRNLEAKFGDLVFHSAAARLAKWLLQLSETTGEREKDTIRFNVRLPHQNLANLIATSRETVSALIGHFQRQGLRIQDHRYIRLLDTHSINLKTAVTVESTPMLRLCDKPSAQHRKRKFS